MSKTVDLPCGSEVYAQVEPGGEVRIVIDGDETYTGLTPEAMTEISEAFADAAQFAQEERDNVRVSGRRVVLTGKFHGTRQDLERRIRQAGGTIQDFVYPGALVITGTMPYRGSTFKARKAAEVNAQTVTAREAHEALTRKGY